MFLFHFVICYLQNQFEKDLTPLVSYNKASVYPDWIKRNISIPAQNEDFHILIRGEVGYSFSGDAAIDDISIRQGICWILFIPSHKFFTMHKVVFLAQIKNANKIYEKQIYALFKELFCYWLLPIFSLLINFSETLLAELRKWSSYFVICLNIYKTILLDCLF